MRHLIRLGSLVAASAVAALVLDACSATPKADAGDVLARAAAAMGSASLKTLRYTAEGSGQTFGQAFVPTGTWPKVSYPSWTRSIDYEAAAMRDEVVLARAEPLGGGGYPLEGQQRNDQFLVGNVAWNGAGNNVVPGARFVADRVHQLWITPHGVIEAARRRGATVAAGGGGGGEIVFEEPGRFRARATVDARGLVTRVESIAPDAVLGDNTVVTQYDGYRDVGSGVMFPARIRQSSGGQPVLDLEVKDVQPNVAVTFSVPDAARNAAERVTSEKVAEGVWFIAGGSHNSVLIEMIDHLVLVEAPLNDARAAAVFDEIKRVAAGKPVRFVVNSHAHFDHSGGLRYAVGEGATVITHRTNDGWFERALAQPATVVPDRLARSGRKPRVQGVDDGAVLTDGQRTIELHRITGGPHSESMLMVALPKERLLIEADAYTPLAPGAAPPAKPNANNANLIENIERLRLDIDRILPLHGRVVPLAELYTTAGRTAPPR
jgi:glyoxylase-like metal-dependent hydrolase (beta-lactamase superfamily II)